MKLTKISAIALAATLFTACSDDDSSFNYNTASDVVVSMKEAKVEVMENVGIFNVPVEITGTPNGYVEVTVECTETGEFPAIENRHYFLTTATINIPQDDSTGNIEFTSIDRRGADESRTYNVTIVSVKGATIGANKTTTVQIDDKGSSPTINQLTGKWLVMGNQYNSATHLIDDPYVTETQMRIVEDNGNGGGKVMLSGIAGRFQIQLDYDYDVDEKYGEFKFVYGSPAMSGQDFRYVTSNGSTDEAPIYGVWNFAFNAATFADTETTLCIGAFENDKFAGLVWMISGFTITKIPD